MFPGEELRIKGGEEMAGDKATTEPQPAAAADRSRNGVCESQIFMMSLFAVIVLDELYLMMQRQRCPLRAELSDCSADSK